MVKKSLGIQSFWVAWLLCLLCVLPLQACRGSFLANQEAQEGSGVAGSAGPVSRPQASEAPLLSQYEHSSLQVLAMATVARVYEPEQTGENQALVQASAAAARVAPGAPAQQLVRVTDQYVQTLVPENVYDRLRVVLDVKKLFSPEGLFCLTCAVKRYDAGPQGDERFENCFTPSLAHRATQERKVPRCLIKRLADSGVMTTQAVLAFLERDDSAQVINKNILAKSLAAHAALEGNVSVLSFLLWRGFPVDSNLAVGRGQSRYLLNFVCAGSTGKAEKIARVLLDARVTVMPEFIQHVREHAFSGDNETRTNIKRVWKLLHEHELTHRLFEKEEQFFSAVTKGSEADVQTMLSADTFSMAARDVEGNTALMHAVRGDNPEAVGIVRLLLPRCSRDDLLLLDAAGNAVHKIACENGKIEMARLIGQRFEQCATQARPEQGFDDDGLGVHGQGQGQGT